MQEKKEMMKQRIDAALTAFLDKKIAEANEISPFSGKLMEQVKEYCLRKGKRIRPLLVVYGYKCFREGPEEAIISASIATELLHAYLLIHDDIMDKSDVRRGLPTFHKVFEKVYAEQGIENPVDYATNSSILAGDILAALATEPLIVSPFPEKSRIEALSLFNKTNSLTGYGQEIDVLLELKKEATIDDVALVHTLKTANYTIKAPLLIGAILAGATNEQKKVLEKFSILAGRAFQIQDDILGVFGDEKKIGKPADSDLKEGKKTTLVVYAFENGDAEQKEALRHILGNTALGRADLERARELFEETGALEKSKNMALELAEQALQVIEPADFLPEGKQFLVGLARTLVDREY